MKVLVCCEESQSTCLAFRALGVEAYSCDIKECSGGAPQFHLKGDCFYFLKQDRWDLVIAHPPCTYLCVAGAVNMYVNGTINQQRYQQMLVGREFFMRFFDLDERIRLCVENLRAMRLVDLPPYSQVIQPFQFGDPYTKQTLLWLRSLPLLMPLCYSTSKRVSLGCESWVGTHYGSTQRSKSFKGISAAMAKQWYNLPSLWE